MISVNSPTLINLLTSFTNRQKPSASQPAITLTFSGQQHQNPTWPISNVHYKPLFKSVYFAGEQKVAANRQAQDRYLRYTPDNTPAPLATWRSLASTSAKKYHRTNADVLEKYVAGTGEYYQDIPWIRQPKKLGEVPYAIFDTETTGLSVYDRIIQLAASQVKEDHQVSHITDFNKLIHPGYTRQGDMFEIKGGASQVHGIYPEDVEGQPTMADLLPDFRNTILKKNGLVVAYNAKFDIGMLNTAIQRWNTSADRKSQGFIRPLEPALVLDPYILIQRLHPFVALRKRLGDHYEILMGRPLENKHDAQADVDATVDVLKYTFKYLEKHRIPKTWAEWISKNLDTKGMSGPQQMAVIKSFVRAHRKELETQMPVEPEPLTIIDVLRFQHGAAVNYDGTNLPKLDISLNQFGWDGSKNWSDRDDTLDAEITAEIRQERDAENRKFIQARFRNDFVSPTLDELASSYRQAVWPRLDEGSPTGLKRETTLRTELLDKAGALFVQHLLNQTLPTLVEESPADAVADHEAPAKITWQDFEQEMQTLVLTQLHEGLPDTPKTVPTTISADLHKRINRLSKALVKHAQQEYQDLGERFFYQAVPIDPNKPLIHPDVLI